MGSVPPLVNGLEPAPERSKRTTWSTFLKAHWRVLAASDFFSVEVWTPPGLMTHYVLFVISITDRVVHIAGGCVRLSFENVGITKSH